MQPSFFARIWPGLSLIGISALGTLLRLFPLNWREYWYDEAFTGITVRQNWGTMMNVIVNDVHPPMYYWLLKIWTLVLGTDPTIIRLFSVAFGIATIGLIYAVIREAHPKSHWPALAGAFMAAINPFLVNYSQEARMYSLVGFLLLLAAFLLLRNWRTGLMGYRIGYAITLLAILLTHYVGAIFVLCLAIADVYVAWRNHVDPQKTAFTFAQGYLIPFVGGLMWLPSFLAQRAAHSSLGWVPNVTFDHFPISLHVLLFGAPVGVIGVPPALGYWLPWLHPTDIAIIIVISLSVLATWLTLKKKWDESTALAGFMALSPMFMVWVLQLANQKLYVERYLTGSALFLIIFLVLARAKASTYKPLAAAVVAYALLVALIKPEGFGSTYPQIISKIQPELKTSQVIFTNPFGLIIGRVYAGEEHVDNLKLYNLSNLNENFSSWALVPKESPLQSLPSSPHVIITDHPEAFPDYTEISVVHELHILKRL